MRFAALIVGSILCSAVPSVAQTVKSPGEMFAAFPNRVADVPAGWLLNNPIQLDVYYNLKAAPNSAAADAFLREQVRVARSLPHVRSISIQRFIAPAKFTYAARLTFANWRAYQLHETSKGLLDYYYKVWKPAVAQPVEETVQVLDLEAVKR